MASLSPTSVPPWSLGQVGHNVPEPNHCHDKMATLANILVTALVSHSEAISADKKPNHANMPLMPRHAQPPSSK